MIDSVFSHKKFDKCPNEILMMIFKNLGLHDLEMVAMVNRRFYHLVNRNFFWNPKRFRTINTTKGLRQCITVSVVYDGHLFLTRNFFFLKENKTKGAATARRRAIYSGGLQLSPMRYRLHTQRDVKKTAYNNALVKVVDYINSKLTIAEGFPHITLQELRESRGNYGQKLCTLE